jgi:CheY-like chemotaxis protein
MNPTTFSLRSLLEDLELMFRMRTDSKKLTFALEGLGHIPQYVEGDEGKLRQILINLLGNAVKFTETGGIVLRVQTSPQTAGGVQLEAEVEDTGPGIPEEEQKDLFKPFQQARSGRLMRSGTGLGLAICKEFVTLMGGDISVVSQVGKGSLFKFHVQLGVGEVGYAEKKPESHRVKCLSPGQPVRRILIADDEELNGTFLSKLLGEIGFETRQVTDGNKAIKEFDAWRPHLILMDMRMPEMDGCEAARRIRASEGGRDVKIVGVSASAFEENRQEAIAAGADDYLTKPFRETVLFEKLERLLGVEYELSEKTTSEKDLARPAGRTALTADALAALPAKFTRKLRDAVVKADFDRMIGLIDGIDGRCGPAVHELRGLVERFEYNRLLDLLQAKGKDR